MAWRRNHLDRAEWEAACADAPFEQSWAYGAVAESFGARVHRCADDDGRALVQAIDRGIGPLRCVWLPRGVHGDPARLSDLRGALPGRVALFSPHRGLRIGHNPARAELTLGAGLRARLDKKWRNRLAAAERSGIVVRHHAGVSEWLISAEARQRRSRRYRALPAAWLRRLDALAPGCVESWIAWVGGERIAGITCLRHGRQVRYHLGFSDAEGRRRSAHNLLLWRAMEDAAARDARAFDLGVIDAARLPGLTRFKLGTGARAIAAEPIRLLPPWAQASDGSQSTMEGKATSVAMVSASATKNGITPRNTS